MKLAVRLAASAGWAWHLGWLVGGTFALARALACTLNRVRAWHFARQHRGPGDAPGGGGAGSRGAGVVHYEAVSFPFKTSIATALLAVRTVQWLRACALLATSGVGPS